MAAPLELERPQDRAVYQRNGRNEAGVPILGALTTTQSVTRAEARYVVMEDATTSGPWFGLIVLQSEIEGRLTVPAGGWYRIEVRLFNGEEQVGEAEVERVGVGEVFVTSGQSNSTNSCQPPLTPEHDTVSAWTGTGWRHAADPQPIADGSGGSVWSRLGDLLADEFDVPIGFLASGVGGTAVGQWQENGDLYPRLRNALKEVGPRGARAVLWHQGESDAGSATSTENYARLLKNVIELSRCDAGWEVPWGIAIVSFLPGNTAENNAKIQRAQRMLLAEMPDVFCGPNTDKMGVEFRFDSTHFNGPGLAEHARMWKESIVRTFGDRIPEAPRPRPISAFRVESFEGAATETGNYTVGYRFTTDAPILVTALGVLDEKGDGLERAHQVAIWNSESSYRPLVAAMVPAGEEAALDGAFRFVAVTTITLPAGSYVAGTNTFLGADPYYEDLSVIEAPGITFLERRYARGSILQMPEIARVVPPAYFGPNFKCIPANFSLTQPTTSSFFQRTDSVHAAVPVSGKLYAPQPFTRVVARYRSSDGERGLWQELNFTQDGFSGTLDVPTGGFYEIDVRALSGNLSVGGATVGGIVVGEVFITAGQSNSANFGTQPYTPKHGMVLAWTGEGWRHAYDPQPIANGAGGSPWPRLGDLLAEDMDVPIGFMSVGVGGTSLAQWQPGGSLYPQLQQAVRAAGVGGARAVLWHQGESDSLNGTSPNLYASLLRTIIDASQNDAGWPIPWGVAIAAFHPSANAEAEARVREGQHHLIDSYEDVFEGPNTDELGDEYRSPTDHVHFNDAGLDAHAEGWRKAIYNWFETTYAPTYSNVSLPALTVESTRTASVETGSYTAGYAFRVDAPITLTALGLCDIGRNGLASAHQVAIWKADEPKWPIAQALLPAGEAADLIGDFRYVPVTSVTLEAGLYVAGAEMFFQGDAYYGDVDISTVQGVTWIERRYARPGAFRMPDITRVTPPAYIGPSFLCVPPRFKLTQPTAGALFQRRESGGATVPVAGKIHNVDGLMRIEARWRRASENAAPEAGWQEIPLGPTRFDAALAVPPGLHFVVDIRVRAGEQTIARQSVHDIAVGEVFVTAGGANAANHGAGSMTPSESVLAWNGVEWRRGFDPLPLASGVWGSPWGRLGDLLNADLGVPVGFIACGVADSTVADWTPGGPYYARLAEALEAAGPTGPRAVLWHQGEADALAGTSADAYANRLRLLIERTRADAGREIPWAVALAARDAEATSTGLAAVRAGQSAAIAELGGVFAGPDTDTLGEAFREGSRYFTDAGLDAHAALWLGALQKFFTEPQAKPSSRWVLH